MNETKKGIQSKEETPQLQGGGKTTNPSNGWRRLMSKKWAFPAIYMASAAIILTLMWVYQDMGKQTLSTDKAGKELIESNLIVSDLAKQTDASLLVTAPVETMQWPVKDRNEVVISMPYFDTKATNEKKQAALIQYNNTFTPNTGINLARTDDQAFDVMAALSGKVTRVEQNPLVGNLVEITHNDQLVTVYQSLSNVKVAMGSEVKKGEVIATAGRNELEKDDGVHVHFEVRQGQEGPAMNPEAFLIN